VIPAGGGSYAGKVVLVTGGTKGIGLSTALVFAAEGAQTVLTYAWGSADEAAVTAQIVQAGGPPPLIVQADATRGDDTDALLTAVHARFGAVHAFISNASVALVVNGMDDYSERGFMKSLRGTAWPTFGYLTAMRAICGAYPKYVVVMSSDGPDRFTPGYDFVAASKAAAEAMTKYVAYRLRGDGVRINVLRSRAIRTASFDSTFGHEFYDFLHGLVDEGWFMSPDEVGRAAFALCSGHFDGMTGQTVMADHGNTFFDGISYLYERRERLGL
jgi:NAD(P)-dependent dehydrogenase (short-subunit alcohol dehydrogenase family)